jgi:hypothetical protein
MLRISSKILGILLLFIAASGRIVAQSRTIARQDQREARYVRQGLFDPVWSAQGLLGADSYPSDEPVIWCIDREGWREEIPFSFTGGRYMSILGISGAPNGSIVLIGTAYSNDGRSGAFLASISSDRKNIAVTRLFPYIPRAITVAPDGVIWTAGYARADEASTPQYNLLKRFDPSGNVLSVLPVKVRGVPWSAAGDATSWSILRASKDRVGWFTPANQYVEFSLDGREIGRWDGPQDRNSTDYIFASFALSRENVALYSTNADQDKAHGKLILWTLDRTKNVWREIGGERISRWAHVFGFDSETPVLSEQTGDYRSLIVRYSLTPMR